MKPMARIFDDGGRAAAGYKGAARDCVARSIAIVTQRPYVEVYKALSAGMGTMRHPKTGLKRPASARNGVYTKERWFKAYMKSLGFTWVPTMGIGTGCKVHLAAGELPDGRLVVQVSNHCTAVIDGIIHDTFDPQREKGRCVYGYWRLDTV